VNLLWDASSDNVAVTGYLVYRDGALLATLTGSGTSYTDTTVAPARTYNYQVRAADSAGNQSALSNPTNLTAPGTVDTQPPTPPGNPSATAPSSSQVNLSWAPSTDDVRVTGYEVARSGVVLKSLPDNATTYSDETAQPGTTYTYSVKAFDASGNYSTASPVGITTPSSGGGDVDVCPVG
jgi:chitinase